MQSVIPQTGAGGNKCFFWRTGMFSCQQSHDKSARSGLTTLFLRCVHFLELVQSLVGCNVHHIWQNWKPKLSLYFNLHLGRQACQGVGINEALVCCPGGSGGTLLLPQAGKEPKSQAQSTQSRASCCDFASTFPLLASLLHSSDKQRNRAESSVRNPKTVGLVFASICRQCTMLIPLWISPESPFPRPSDHPLSACLQVSLL